MCGGVGLLLRLRALKGVQYLVALVDAWPHFVLAGIGGGILEMADDAAVGQVQLGREIEFHHTEEIPQRRDGSPDGNHRQVVRQARDPPAEAGDSVPRRIDRIESGLTLTGNKKDEIAKGRMSMRVLRAAGLCVLLCLCVAFSQQRAWPQARTIRIVISVPPGGTIDFLVRVLADHLSRTRGQTIVVESRPGAGSIIAAETVARATPDGNTLLINSNGQMISPILRKVNFDPRTSFEPICFLVDSPQVLVVNSKSPFRTLAEFVDAARAKPGELSISTVGPNTTQHIAVERFKRAAGINLTYVPFTGGAPAINALLGGHVSAVLQNYSEAGPQVKAGALRALAVPSPERVPPLPDVPTIIESGYKDFIADVWFGLVAPARTPQPIIAQYIEWFGSAIEAPDVKEKLTAHALYPNRRCGPDFAAHIQRQVDQFTRVIAELGLKGK